VKVGPSCAIVLASSGGQAWGATSLMEPTVQFVADTCRLATEDEAAELPAVLRAVFGFDAPLQAGQAPRRRAAVAALAGMIRKPLAAKVSDSDSDSDSDDEPLAQN
jgi:hypothetical protein